MEVQRRLKAAAFSMATITWQMNYMGYQNTYNGHSPMWWFRPEIDGALMTEEPNYGLPTHFEFTSFTIQTPTLDGGSVDSKRLNVYLSTANGGKGALIYYSSTVSGRYGTYQIDVDAAGISALNSAIAAETFYGISIEFYRASSRKGDTGILQAVNEGLLPQTVTLQADLVFAASPATATALVVDPAYVGFTQDVSVAVDAALASALAGEAEGSVVNPVPVTVAVDAAVADAAMPGGHATETLVGVRVLASSVSGGGVTGTTAAEVAIDGFWGGTLIADLPDLDSVKDKPQDQVKALVLTIKNTYAFRLSDTDTYAFNAKTVKRVNGVDSDVGAVTTYTMGDTISVTVPYEAGLQGLGVVVPSTGVSSHKVRFDNPANDTLTESYYTVYIEVDPGAFPEAAPAEASGEMVSPDVDTVQGAIHGAVAATATAEMPGGRFPHNNFNATPATATATMGAAWFKSDRVVSADVMDVSVEAPEIAGVSVGRNISVAVQPAVMRNAWIVNPMEVNEDVSDPYWNRVLGRSPDGTRPPMGQWGFQWYRLNERSGDRVYSTNRGTGLKNNSGMILEGDYEWGQPGPNGKRALKVINAEAGYDGDDEVNGYPPDWANGASLEFTVKINPEDTQRMDLFSGRVWNTGLGHRPNMELLVYVENGRLFARSIKGGTSIKKINDGKFHHIVITTGWSEPSGYWQMSYSTLEIWIDGRLDRAFVTNENREGDNSAQLDSKRFSAPRQFFGKNSEYKFKGEILDIVFRRAELRSHEIMDLYLDQFGYKAARAGVIEGARGEAFQGAKVESNMKRMLILTWTAITPSNPSVYLTNPDFDRSVTVRDMQLSPMGLHRQRGAGDYMGKAEWDLGRFLTTVQKVDAVGPAITEEARARLMHENAFAGGGSVIRDPVTGQQTFVNLQTDIDLDQFDVIAFQAYPNRQYRNQGERLAYERFFESVKQAMVDGHKFWITDAYLASDLGLVSDVEYVPTMGRMLSNGQFGSGGNDVRGYEIFPTVSVDAGQTVEEGVPAGTGPNVQPRNGPVPFPNKQEGVMPRLPHGIPMGSQHGLMNLWGRDFHQNNGWRLVNEVEGLTDLPSWELDEMAARDKTVMLPRGLEWHQFAYRLKNRSGEDFSWGYKGNDGVDRIITKPSERAGLKAGDEFYDWIWYKRWAQNLNQETYFWNRMNSQRRIRGTWAVPPGHLRVGTPLTTFRRTVWNEYGNEVPNPYAGFIRNAVIRAGDRLPDGRKVNGYVFMEFAEHPIWAEIMGLGIEKQLANAPGDNPGRGGPKETEYSIDWDHNTHSRWNYGAGGSVTIGGGMTLSFTKDSNGIIQPVFGKAESTELPIAEDVWDIFPTTHVPHLHWNARGLMWLLYVGVDEEESSTYGAVSATAQGSMRSPMVSTEFDRSVSVGAATATARAVDPEEATVRDTQVMATPATATAMMNGLVGGYKAEVMSAYAMMPENVLRPLDVEEVLFFTVSFTQNTIYLRMEEN